MKYIKNMNLMIHTERTSIVELIRLIIMIIHHLIQINNQISQIKTIHNKFLLIKLTKISKFQNKRSNNILNNNNKRHFPKINKKLIESLKL